MCIFFQYMWIIERIVMFMKAMSYILQGLESRISYDELDNLYIETAGLSWYEDEFLMYMGISWNYGDEYIFISKEDCNLYNQYEIIVPNDFEYDSSVRRPYYRMRGKPVTEEQAFELIRRTDNFFRGIDEIRHSDDFVCAINWDNWLIHKNHYPQGYGWVHTDGTIGNNSKTQTYPELYEFIGEWFEKLRKFPYLDLVIAVTCWNELPNALWEDLGNNAKRREMELSDDLFSHHIYYAYTLPTQASQRIEKYSRIFYNSIEDSASSPVRVNPNKEAI